MRRSLFSTYILQVALILSLIVSCAHREGEPEARTNPYDAGGGVWKENSSPLINAHSDSLWYNFNHSSASGTIRIHVEEDDLNFPYDTLVGSVLYKGTEIKLPRFSSKKDTAILLSGIKPDTAAQCTVVVYDSKKSVSTRVLSITAPDSIPPVPPSARVINSSQEVTLTWAQNPNTSYTVYYSDSLKGPYSGSITVSQTGNNIVAVSDKPSEYLPRYYIVASYNQFGTARSTDTLIGRRYYSGLTTPSISSISQGSYSAYILLTCNVSTYNNDHIEIYRSINDTSAFRLIGTSKLTSSSSSYSTTSIYYYDSVKTSATYYYKIQVIDKLGRCSFPSSTRYGYLQKLYAPALYINSSTDYLSLSWSTVSGAAKYRVYRSPHNCSDSLKLISEDFGQSYIDTPPSSKLFYYTVCAVSSNDLEGNTSSCKQGKITILPQPDSVIVTSNYYPKHVALTWRKVTGADGYIIYRSNNSTSSDSIPLDTISSTTFNDTLPDYLYRYYRIAAFNIKGTGILSPVYSGSVIRPVFSSYTSRNDSAFLSFTTNSRATRYLIYKSSNQTDFTLIDSTTNTSYIALLKDFTTWYYRITIMTPEGESYPSTTASIVRQLRTPYNIKVTSLVNGVRIEWSKVIEAEKYAIYRSASSSSNTFYRSTFDTFFVDTLPEGSLFYYYSIRSVNTITTSPLSSSYKGSKLSPPATPISISIISQPTSLYLSWSMSSNSSPPLGYNIYRSTDNVTFKKINTTQNFNYTDSVPDASRYYYRISAYNNLGESSQSVTVSATLLTPSAPQNLTGTIATSKAYIRITWSPVSSIKKYSVYRSTAASGTYVFLATVQNSNVFYDSTCRENTTYFYKTASIDAYGQSSLHSAYTYGIRLGPPEISIINKYDNGVIFWWNKLSYSIQYYNIYRATSVDGPYTKIDSTTGSSYLDSTAKIYSYYFKISAVNVVESDLSSAATASTTIPEISITATQGTITIPNIINISWTAVSNALSYRIYKAPTDSFNRNITYIAGGLTSRSYDHYVESDSIYYYKMTIFTSSGESGFSTQTAIGYRYPTAKPLPIPTANGASGKDYVSLAWQKPPTSVGYNKYNIYRSASADGAFELIGSTTETSYKDVPPLRYPTVYWYTIKAVNQLGESTPVGPLPLYLTQ